MEAALQLENYDLILSDFSLPTFNGLAAGSALLALTAGLKFLETRTRRDIYIVVLVIYFLALASLLQSESQRRLLRSHATTVSR